MKLSAFGLEQGLYFAFDDKSEVAGVDVGAVVEEDVDGHVRVETVEDAKGGVDAGQDAVFFNNQAARPARLGGDAAEGGVVAVGYVFGKGEVDEAVDEVVGGLHSMRMDWMMIRSSLTV